MQLVLDVQLTVVASVEPNLKSVASLPRPKPVPVIVTMPPSSFRQGPSVDTNKGATGNSSRTRC